MTYDFSALYQLDFICLSGFFLFWDLYFCSILVVQQFLFVSYRTLSLQLFAILRFFLIVNFKELTLNLNGHNSTAFLYYKTRV